MEPTTTSTIQNLSREEILGEIERNRDAGNIWNIKQIKDELVAAVPNRVYNHPKVECLRYAERALGVLVRRGQTGPDRYITARRDGNNVPEGMFTSMHFFSSEQERAAAYFYADDVTDTEFDSVMAQVKANGSMSRMAVARALSGGKKKRPQWVDDARIEKRPAELSRRRRLDVDRVIRSSLDQIGSVFEGIESIMTKDAYTEISVGNANTYVGEINQFVGQLRTLRVKIQRGQGQ